MFQGQIQDLKLGGAHFTKLRRAEGGAKILGVAPFCCKGPTMFVSTSCGTNIMKEWNIFNVFFYIPGRMTYIGLPLLLVYPL
jgi:hypothetical protein